MTARRKTPASADAVRRRLDRRIRALQADARRLYRDGAFGPAAETAAGIRALQGFRADVFGLALRPYHLNRPLFARPARRRKAA